MIIDYEIKNADIFDIIPNELNKKIAFLAKDNENNEYIFKPSWIDHYHNINEFISHYIASIIGAPILKGVFLKIDAENMKEYEEKIKKGIPHAVLPTYIPPYNEAVFFSVAYLQDATPTKTISDLEKSLKNIKNKKPFFSQFPLDQYLRNPDRHLGNHLFYKDDSKLNFYLIDFDRIFNGYTNWSSLKSDLGVIDCFGDPGYNADLYKFVKDEDIKTVHDFAAKIEKEIDDEAITDICNIINDTYGIEKVDLVKIETWLKDRRALIYAACLENEKCYENVYQEGVFK